MAQPHSVMLEMRLLTSDVTQDPMLYRKNPRIIVFTHCADHRSGEAAQTRVGL